MRYLELNGGSQVKPDNGPFFRVYASNGSEAETFSLDGPIIWGRVKETGLRLLGWEEKGEWGEQGVIRFFKIGKEMAFMRYRSLLGDIIKENRDVFTRTIPSSIYEYASDIDMGPHEDFNSPIVAECRWLKHELEKVMQILEGEASGFRKAWKVRLLLIDVAACIKDWELPNTEILNTLQTRRYEIDKPIFGEDGTSKAWELLKTEMFNALQTKRYEIDKLLSDEEGTSKAWELPETEMLNALQTRRLEVDKLLSDKEGTSNEVKHSLEAGTLIQAVKPVIEALRWIIV
ncbi:uncharacterized protein LOC113289055 isoform X2 [Papaver somniferum]|nr:uncharacterized protein LOC113289055 isoform X2 [Papaver somniferum]